VISTCFAGSSLFAGTTGSTIEAGVQLNLHSRPPVSTPCGACATLLGTRCFVKNGRMVMTAPHPYFILSHRALVRWKI